MRVPLTSESDRGNLKLKQMEVWLLVIGAHRQLGLSGSHSYEDEQIRDAPHPRKVTLPHSKFSARCLRWGKTANAAAPPPSDKLRRGRSSPNLPGATPGCLTSQREAERSQVKGHATSAAEPPASSDQTQ